MEQLVTTLPYFQLFDVQGKRVKKMKREENSSELHPKHKGVWRFQLYCNWWNWATSAPWTAENVCCVTHFSPNVSEGDDSPRILLCVPQLIAATGAEITSLYWKVERYQSCSPVCNFKRDGLRLLNEPFCIREKYYRTLSSWKQYRNSYF